MENQKKSGSNKKNVSEMGRIIKQLRKAVKARYPKFYKGTVFATLSKKQKIVTYLNYVGLSWLVRLLVIIKGGKK